MRLSGSKPLFSTFEDVFGTSIQFSISLVYTRTQKPTPKYCKRCSNIETFFFKKYLYANCVLGKGSRTALNPWTHPFCFRCYTYTKSDAPMVNGNSQVQKFTLSSRMSRSGRTFRFTLFIITSAIFESREQFVPLFASSGRSSRKAEEWQTSRFPNANVMRWANVTSSRVVLYNLRLRDGRSEIWIRLYCARQPVQDFTIRKKCQFE